MSLVFKNNYENNILIKHINLKRKRNIGDSSPKIKKINSVFVYYGTVEKKCVKWI